MKAAHALLTLVIGMSFGAAWLRIFWDDRRNLPALVLAAPAAAALLGLSHWVAYDFSLRHWAGDFSLGQALFNTTVAVVLVLRRTRASAS